MIRPDRDRLSGWIEGDEALVGGLEEAVFGRQTLKKSWVVIAAQVDGAGIGRIRMLMIPDCSAATREKASRLMPRVSCRLAVETLAARYLPTWSGILLPTLLSGRIHLSLQPSEVQEPR
jgi:hypothetical protein